MADLEGCWHPAMAVPPDAKPAAMPDAGRESAPAPAAHHALDYAPEPAAYHAPERAPDAGLPTAGAPAMPGSVQYCAQGDSDDDLADLLFNAALARLTASVSPVAVAGAWFDWAAHLLLAPSKQLQLAMFALDGAVRWLAYAGHAALPQADEPAPVIIAPPSDRRFADPAWQVWPYNATSQAFLLAQQWWQCATTGVRGVSRHHAEVVTFIARQLLDSAAPSNFLATNPVAQATSASGGHNAGVVAPAGPGGRSYQVATHRPNAPFIDADSWRASQPVRAGSWRPEWEAWLARHAGPLQAPPPPSHALDDAPGAYVLEP
ncbi:poly-beta-hydroxybutyrate polymerase N-terminal domain-containing protein [Oxalobacteraceae bacterium A2-2]